MDGLSSKELAIYLELATEVLSGDTLHIEV
jgi:hypothetical protein